MRLVDNTGSVGQTIRQRSSYPHPTLADVTQGRAEGAETGAPLPTVASTIGWRVMATSHSMA